MNTDETRFGASCAEVLAKWDAGEAVWSAEMGGLGPGYEQDIQLTVFEDLRAMLDMAPDASQWDDPEKWKADRDKIDKVVMPKIDKLGLSGAQWGAAMNLAAILYRQGPTPALLKLPQDRRILVRKNFPSF